MVNIGINRRRDCVRDHLKSWCEKKKLMTLEWARSIWCLWCSSQRWLILWTFRRQPNVHGGLLCVYINTRNVQNIQWDGDSRRVSLDVEMNSFAIWLDKWQTIWWHPAYRIYMYRCRGLCLNVCMYICIGKHVCTCMCLDVHVGMYASIRAAMHAYKLCIYSICFYTRVCKHVGMLVCACRRPCW